MANFLNNIFGLQGAPRTGAAPLPGMLAQAAQAGAPNAAALSAQAPAPDQTAIRPTGGPQALQGELEALLAGGQGQGAPPQQAAPPQQGQAMQPPVQPQAVMPTEPTLPPQQPGQPAIGISMPNERWDDAFRRRTGDWPKPLDYSREQFSLDMLRRLGRMPTKLEMIQHDWRPTVMEGQPEYTVG